MTTIPLLPNLFPELWNQVEPLARELKADTYPDWPALNSRLGFLNDPDLIELLNAQIPGWLKIATLKNGVTARHTILVLATCMNLPEYTEKPPQIQAELQWAALLHDIDKDVSG